MSRIDQLDSRLGLIDLEFQEQPQVIASYALGDSDDLGLVETGPTTTLPALIQGLEEVGGLERLKTVVVTHIHLDHAGALGELLARVPHLRAYVHRVGAPHVIDPTKLLNSAARIYGNQMDLLWGSVRPAPADQVIAVDEGDIIRVGGEDLTVIYTPGHASHHIALWSPRRRAVFTGDVAGVRLPCSEHVRPPTPPPDIDLGLWRESVARLLALQPETLYLTHFGPHADNVKAHFETLLERLDAWTELVRLGLEEGQDPVTIVDNLRREGDSEVISEGGSSDNLRQYELATPYGMTVDGLIRYLRKAERVGAA